MKIEEERYWYYASHNYTLSSNVCRSILFTKIMEQFGYKIAYNSLTRDFQTGIKNTLIQICIYMLNM